MAPQSSVPPSLPPSVEEAYRRKCVQLKNRTNEVEDANDAAGLRLSRVKRQIEKLRIERAFLLEQLAKRTSTNVEDSEGSPSPPPTVRPSPAATAGAAALPVRHGPARGPRTGFNLMEDKPADIRTGTEANPVKPKDKPLRTKRGHRKSTANDAEPKAGASKDVPSPASESQSLRPEKAGKSGSANGVTKTSHKPSSAFDLYCADARPVIEGKSKSEDVNMDEELARGWEELPEAEKDEFRAKLEEQQQQQQQQSKKQDDKGAKDGVETGKQKERKPSGGSGKAEAQDDDIEMVHYDTEDQETQMDKDGDE